MDKDLFKILLAFGAVAALAGVIQYPSQWAELILLSLGLCASLAGAMELARAADRRNLKKRESE